MASVRSGQQPGAQPLPVSDLSLRRQAPGSRAGAAGQRRAGRQTSSGVALYIVAGILISAVFVLPLLWETFRSLQPESTVSNPPSAASFGHLTFANYRALLSGQDNILRNVVNSLIVGVLTALLT